MNLSAMRLVVVSSIFIILSAFSSSASDVKPSIAFRHSTDHNFIDKGKWLALKLDGSGRLRSHAVNVVGDEVTKISEIGFDTPETICLVRNFPSIREGDTFLTWNLKSDSFYVDPNSKSKFFVEQIELNEQMKNKQWHNRMISYDFATIVNLPGSEILWAGDLNHDSIPDFIMNDFTVYDDDYISPRIKITIVRSAESGQQKWVADEIEEEEDPGVILCFSHIKILVSSKYINGTPQWITYHGDTYGSD